MRVGELLEHLEGMDEDAERAREHLHSARAAQLEGLEIGESIELDGGAIAVVRVGEDTLKWTSRKGTSELDEAKTTKRLAGLKSSILESLAVDAHAFADAPARTLTPPAPGTAEQDAHAPLWTIWRVTDEGEEPLRTITGTMADGYVSLAEEQQKLDPQPVIKLRRGDGSPENLARRCRVFIHPGGWREEPTYILKKSALYRAENEDQRA